jgi:hypothetical protein
VYAYDDANERISMQDNNGTSGAPPAAQYHYTNGQMTSTTDDNGQTVSYLYGYSGEVLCMGYPSGSPNCGSVTSRATPSSANMIVNYGYDTSLRVSSLTAWAGTSGSNSIGYSYADNYNPISVTNITYPTSGTSEALAYGYDKAGNLLSATYGGPILNGVSNTFTPNANN